MGALGAGKIDSLVASGLVFEYSFVAGKDLSLNSFVEIDLLLSEVDWCVSDIKISPPEELESLGTSEV